LIEIAVRFPPIGRATIVLLLQLPQSRVRREIGEWGLREVGLGSVARQDYTVIRTFSAADFEVTPARELAVLLGYDAPVLRGVEAGIRFLQDWFDAWDDFEFVAKEGVDLGDGRVLLLNHLRGHGSGSGVNVIDQEEAQLWESRGGLVTRVSQWWSWSEGLEAVGLPERAGWNARLPLSAAASTR
jgi:ketosteroid isomerase-like protein